MVGRVRDRATFEALRRTGHRARRGPLMVTFAVLPSGDQGPRVAYAVGKRVGSAVVRNRLRRRLRAAVADVGDHLDPGAYMVAAGPETNMLSFEELKAHVTAAMTSAAWPRRS